MRVGELPDKGSDFNPRPPCGGRPENGGKRCYIYKFQSAPSLRRATARVALFALQICISIRALLAEGDDDGLPVTDLTLISIRALLAEGDNYSLCCASLSRGFQSAPSLRRATRLKRLLILPIAFQSAPSLRRATDYPVDAAVLMRISIRALLAEGDCCRSEGGVSNGKFQSAPSLRRATAEVRRGRHEDAISIRALLAEGDVTAPDYRGNRNRFQSAPSLRRATSRAALIHPELIHFNPRPPCGGRRACRPWLRPRCADFNPRPPCGGRQPAEPEPEPEIPISIRALLAEGDPKSGTYWMKCLNFNPRPPCGGRREHGEVSK